MLLHLIRNKLRAAALLAILAWPMAPALAQTINSEQQLKAAYLVNFLKYIEWPNPGSSVTICLFGREQLSPFLSLYEGRLIVGRELRIRRISGPDQLENCQLVFIPDTEEARFGAVLRWVENQPILSVSDAEIFTHQGGGIALVRTDGRLQFDVNMTNLTKANLKPSSQMMRLVRQVIGSVR